MAGTCISRKMTLSNVERLWNVPCHKTIITIFKQSDSVIMQQIEYCQWHVYSPVISYTFRKTTFSDIWLVGGTQPALHNGGYDGSRCWCHRTKSQEKQSFSCSHVFKICQMGIANVQQVLKTESLSTGSWPRNVLLRLLLLIWEQI